MGLFYSRPSPCPVDESDVVITDSRTRPPRRSGSKTMAVAIDLPSDVYTCILEFLIGTQPQQQQQQPPCTSTATTAAAATNNMMDVTGIVSFRLINKSTKLAFDKIHGWHVIYQHLQERSHVLANMVDVLQATIAHPPTTSLSCIMRVDAYLTQCWTLKKAFSVRRQHLEDEVLPRIRSLMLLLPNDVEVAAAATNSTGEPSNHGDNTDGSSGSTTTLRRTAPQQQQTHRLILISEWQYDECILRFEPVGNRDLDGFTLPAIDQSELPFLLA